MQSVLLFCRAMVHMYSLQVAPWSSCPRLLPYHRPPSSVSMCSPDPTWSVGVSWPHPHFAMSGGCCGSGCDIAVACDLATSQYLVAAVAVAVPPRVPGDNAPTHCSHWHVCMRRCSIGGTRTGKGDLGCWKTAGAGKHVKPLSPHGPLPHTHSRTPSRIPLFITLFITAH